MTAQIPSKFATAHTCALRSPSTSALSVRPHTCCAFADAAAPGIIIAQALGRLGNWFNNELYGRATTLPWKL